MPTKPMLDDLELLLVQQLESAEHQERSQHAIPTLEGDFLQGLGRRAAAFRLTGVISNEDGTVGEELKKLREKFRLAAPVSFAADIATATRVDTVLIEEMSVRELAGKPERFEYAFTLREFIPAPAPEEEPPPPPPEPLVSTLIVEVIVEGQPNFDFSKVTVTVDGKKEDGSAHNATLTNRANNIWTEEDFPPGSYTVTAVTTDPPMSGSAQANILEGQTTQVTIVLRPGTTRAIAKAFVVHFRFDKAFIEPCMRKVLNDVAAFAAQNPNDKMVIVGHTDRSGSDAYNLSLGDRRARSVFAYLNLGNDRAGSLAEWNEMRRASTGTLPSLRDNWGVRQYQYMLEDLGFLPGNIDGDHGDQTDTAVRDFRASKGLPPGTTVDDAVWAALIEAYHSQEPQQVDPARLLDNKKDACDGGKLKWLSCGEQMPLPTTPPSSCSPETAWRPNRRTEILFVNQSTLPCEVPEPVTFNLPVPGAVGPAWCLGPGDPNARCCFLTRDANDNTRWLVQPAQPGTISVTVFIHRPDGTPLANTNYVLIAPDGEFMDGERLCGDGRGTPVEGRTDANGKFDYSARAKTPVGIYTIEVKLPSGPHVAHLASEPPSSGRGSIVCARLDTNKTLLEVIVLDGPPVTAVVTPSIKLERNFVIVKKPHTSPVRIQVTLRSDTTFPGTGTLDRSGNIAAVRMFTALAGGTELTFNGTDNVFTGDALAAGVTLFAEAGPAPSGAVGDYTLTLTLNPTITTVTAGPPATAALTAVLFTLDVALSRPSPGATPPLMTEADKINIGRPVQLRDTTFTYERAMLTVRQPVPLIDVPLEAVRQNARVQPFADEIPAAGQAALPDTQVMASAGIPPAGFSFFVEGVTLSTAVRDAGYLLRVQGIAAEVDRVAITTVQVEVTDQPNNAAAAATRVRMGLWDNAFRADGTVFNDEPEANNFAGADTRKFHIRIRDVSQQGTPVINTEWTAADPNNADIFPPANRQVSLVETPAGSGVFISRGLILVTDNDDHQQSTHSGLPAGAPDAGVRRNRDQSNHRLRRASMLGRLAVRYPHPLINTAVLTHRLPVFQRNPEERRRLPIQLFVLRTAPGGGGVVATAPGSPLWTTDMRVVRESYDRIGLRAETVVAPGTPPADIQEERPFIQNEAVPAGGPNALTLQQPPVVIDARTRVQVTPAGGGAARVMNVIFDDNPNAPAAGEVKITRATGQLAFNAAEVPGPNDQIVADYVAVGFRAVLINAPAGINPNNVSLANEATIGGAFPTIGGARIVRVFFTGGLATGVRGEAAPDVDFAGAPDQGTAFIHGGIRTAYTVAHETGHVLTNKSAAVATGHYNPPAAPAGNRLHNNQNLMRNGTSPVEGVNQSKRLWNSPDQNGLDQVQNIMGLPSPYTRNF